MQGHAQGPDSEHGHIDNCKKLANCTNNKDATVTTVTVYPIVLISRSRYFGRPGPGHIMMPPARVTSGRGQWRHWQIWLTLSKTRVPVPVMTLGNPSLTVPPASPASSIDKEGDSEAGASASSYELGIRYPTLQSIYAGKFKLP